MGRGVRAKRTDIGIGIAPHPLQLPAAPRRHPQLRRPCPPCRRHAEPCCEGIQRILIRGHAQVPYRPRPKDEHLLPYLGLLDIVQREGLEAEVFAYGVIEVGAKEVSYAVDAHVTLAVPLPV